MLPDFKFKYIVTNKEETRNTKKTWIKVSLTNWIAKKIRFLKTIYEKWYGAYLTVYINYSFRYLKELLQYEITSYSYFNW